MGGPVSGRIAGNLDPSLFLSVSPGDFQPVSPGLQYLNPGPFIQAIADFTLFLQVNGAVFFQYNTTFHKKVKTFPDRVAEFCLSSASPS
nr:hypothetical protein [Nitrospina gracilis]